MNEKNKMGKGKKILIIVLAIIVVLFIAIMATPSDENSNTTTTETTTKVSTENSVRQAIIDVVDEENLETFNYVPSNNFSLIKFKGSSNLNNEMTVKGMYLDIFNILKAIQPIIDTDVDFNIVYPLQDQYGNSSDVIVIKATFTKETIKKIDFENALFGNIPQMADEWWNHNAVNINE